MRGGRAPRRLLCTLEENSRDSKRQLTSRSMMAVTVVSVIRKALDFRAISRWTTCELCSQLLHKFLSRPSLGKCPHVFEVPRRYSGHFRKATAEVSGQTVVDLCPPPFSLPGPNVAAYSKDVLLGKFAHLARELGQLNLRLPFIHRPTQAASGVRDAGGLQVQILSAESPAKRSSRLSCVSGDTCRNNHQSGLVCTQEALRFIITTDKAQTSQQPS